MKSNINNVVDKVYQTIVRHNLISKTEKIITGVSGGADSVCLLHILNILSKQMGFSLHCVHVNHKIRGQEANEDECFVKAFSEALGIPYTSFAYNVKEIALQKKISEEEAGRIARYNAFEEARKKENAQKIAVAHNSNDQAETVFMNILRGSGLKGLKGMDYINGYVIRPLLDITRQDIEKYCKDMDLSFRTDSTNMLPSYTRNKIRLLVLPYIKTVTGINVEKQLLSLAELSRQDEDYLEQVAEDVYGKSVEVSQLLKDRIARLPCAEINTLHPAISSRIARKAIEQVKGDLTGIEKKHISMLLDFVNHGANGSVIELPKGIRARHSDNFIEIYLNHDRNNYANNCENIEYEYSFSVPSAIMIPEADMLIKTYILSKNEFEGEKKSELLAKSKRGDAALFDYDIFEQNIRQKLVVRNRRRHDRFKPVNSTGSKKIKDYFIDCKMPREKRYKVPLLALGNEILWIAGVKQSDKFKLAKDTGNILVIELVK